MGLFGGILSPSKKQTTNTAVNTTTTNTTRDIGLTGKDAIALAEVAQLGSVALSSQSNQRDVATFNTLNDTLRYLFGSSQQNAIRVNDSFNVAVTENGKSFSQLVGGANNLVDKADSFVNYSYDTGENILDFAYDSQEQSYKFTGDTLARAESIFDKSSQRSTDFASANISKITEGAIRGAEFVTGTAKDIAGSIIPQTKELQQIALFLVGIVGVVTIATIWKGGK